MLTNGRKLFSLGKLTRNESKITRNISHNNRNIKPCASLSKPVYLNSTSLWNQKGKNAEMKRFYSIDDSGSHDDFKTIRKKYLKEEESKGSNSGNVKEWIKNQLESEKVVVFMKGTPARPMCGFSATVCKILNDQKAPFKGINVLDDETVRNGIKEYTNWPTIPQVFINQEFIGGCDIVRSLDQEGQLADLLKEAKVIE